MTHHWASALFCAFDVHKHEEQRDNQGHPAGHQLDGYQESNEGHDGQQECWEKRVEEEGSFAPSEYEGEPSLGVVLMCGLVEKAVGAKGLQGQVKLDIVVTAISHFYACVEFL